MTITPEWLKSMGGVFCEHTYSMTFTTGSGLRIVVSPLSDAMKDWHVAFFHGKDMLSTPNHFQCQHELMMVFEVFGYQQGIAS